MGIIKLSFGLGIICLFIGYTLGTIVTEERLDGELEGYKSFKGFKDLYKLGDLGAIRLMTCKGCKYNENCKGVEVCNGTFIRFHDDNGYCCMWESKEEPIYDEQIVRPC